MTPISSEEINKETTKEALSKLTEEALDYAARSMYKTSELLLGQAKTSLGYVDLVKAQIDELSKLTAEAYSKLNNVSTTALGDQLTARYNTVRLEVGKATSFLAEVKRAGSFGDNFSALGKSVGALIGAFDLLVALKNNSTQAEVSKEAFIAGVGLASGAAFAWNPPVAVGAAVLGGFAAKKLWESGIAPALEGAEVDLGQPFWDAAFAALGMGQTSIAALGQELPNVQPILTPEVAAWAASGDVGISASRPPSPAFVTYLNSYTATLSKGGSLSDIVALERTKGNLITAADLKAVNGFSTTPDNRIPADYALLVPTKDGAWLSVDADNGASISFNGDEYRSSVPNGSGGGTTVTVRAYDAYISGFDVRQTSTNQKGDVTYEFVGHQANPSAKVIPISIDQQLVTGYIEHQRDTDNDGVIDQRLVTTANGETRDLSSLTDLLDIEYQVDRFSNSASQSTYERFTDWTAQVLLGTSGQLGTGTYGIDTDFGLDPIGAFYDSQSTAYDSAASIARHTAVAVDANHNGLTVAQLTALDANRDGKLSVGEAAGIRMWQDLDENGQSGAGELVALQRDISAADYGLYTQGNARSAAAQSAAPQLPSPSAQPGAANTIRPGADENVRVIPQSNYRALRDTTNTYPVTGGQIDWLPHEVKINAADKTYLIGTDGADSFDAGYYRAYPQYFNLDLLTNFAGGGGDDYVGGSVRNDNIWGGTGNDSLDGYEGNDKLYGEEGNDSINGNQGNDLIDSGIGDDTLFGEAGNDILFGAAGNDELQGGANNDQLLGESGDDRLFGQVGNDALWGGSGNDLLVGFTGANEAKQSLSAGETDDDVLYGMDGNDNLYGGLGNDMLSGGTGDDLLFGEIGNDALWGDEGSDELQGNQGNDRLVGGDGDDKLFGQVGNDTLHGGDGNDLLVGFTATNEAQQTLNPGETDDDVIYGGAGSDWAIGGFGNDQIFGGTGRDELQGNAGADMLYGEADDDNLFGQAGNDILYGGDGNDYLQGFTASNEAQQTLGAGETDNDYLYGGAGSDTLVGNFGDDYLDGGAGADVMIGGQGNDIYIVNSVNDVIYEQAGQGHDVVITNTNYLLNANIEELRLLEGFDIHGTGNALDNRIIGNSSDNILDGITGADALVGGAGNDTYYVDNVGDSVVEVAGQGVDTVQSSISYTLGNDVENLVMLDFSKPEKGVVDGNQVLVYGYPKRNELDYMQGDAVDNYLGTCALTSIANLLTQSGRPTTESQVVNVAIDNDWTVANPNLPANQLGGSNVNDQQSILDSYGIRNDVVYGYNEAGIANLVRSGRGVIVAVNAGSLWGEPSYTGDGRVNHAVTLTGAVYDSDNGELVGFYIADSGRGKVSDMTRFVDIETFRNAVDLPSAYAIYTIEPVKYWDEAINGTGNALSNRLVGNRSDNTLLGLAGNDDIEGDAGDDVLEGGLGVDTLSGGAGNDTFDSAPSSPLKAVVMGSTVRYADNTAQVTVDVEQNGPAIVQAVKAGQTLTAVGSAAVDKIFVGAGTKVDATQTGGGRDEIFLTGRLQDYTFAMVGTTINITRVAGLGSGKSETVSMVAGNAALSDRLFFTDGAIDAYALKTAVVARAPIVLSTTDRTDLTNAGFAVRSEGADRMIGGSGDDIYNVDDMGDTMVEQADEGTDTVQSYLGLTLGANLENLTLLGTQASIGNGNELSNVLTGNSSDNALSGFDGDDVLKGQAGIDALVGGAGNDSLIGGIGNDVLDGGAGDDWLDAAPDGPQKAVMTSNGIWYSDATGRLIAEVASSGGNIVQAVESGQSLTVVGSTDVDKVYVGAGSTVNAVSLGGGRDEVYLTGLSSDYTFATAGTTVVMTRVAGLRSDEREVVTIVGGSATSSDRVVFSDGAIDAFALRAAATANSVVRVAATERSTPSSAGFALRSEGADVLSGGAGNDTYHLDDAGDVVVEFGNEGVDTVQSFVHATLSANVEHLTLMGTQSLNGSGNGMDNEIVGNAGDNTLNGAGGADTLTGGRGNDSYVLTRDGGRDVIHEDDATVGNIDKAVFGSGIAGDQIWFRQTANDLEVSVIGTETSFTIDDWYAGNQFQLEQFVLSDGHLLVATDVNRLVDAMAAFAPPAPGQTTLSSGYQTALNTVIATSWQ